MPSTKPRQLTWIPDRLRAFFGNRTAVSEHLNTPSDARSIMRAKRAAELDHHRMFDTVDRLPVEIKAKIIEHGGDVLKLRDRVEWLRGVLAPPDPQFTAAVRASVDHALTRIGAPRHDPRAFNPASAELRHAIGVMKADAAVELKALEPIALKASPAAEFTLDGLFAIWVRVKAPKIERKHRASLALFKAYLGDRDFRTVTTADVQGWCDDLAQSGHTYTTQKKHIENLQGLFSAVVPRYMPASPAKGVKPDGRAVKARKGSFTGAQLSSILTHAEATNFGGKRRVETLWLIRLAIWTGARINELAQLRKSDVGVESGIARIHFPAVENMAGKTGSRKVPLHPTVADAFLAYAQGSASEYIFGAFKDDPNNGRAGWLISNFRGFLDDACGITDRKLTLHSIRHRFHDALDNAGIAMDRQHVLVGHAGGDVHSRYGQGAGLKQLALDVAKLDPFSD